LRKQVQASDAVTVAQQLVARHERTGALAADRLEALATERSALGDAISERAYRVHAATLARAARQIGELLPPLLTLCVTAYESAYATRGGRWGAAAVVPDLVALVLE
jgi:hypothetical protein